MRTIHAANELQQVGKRISLAMGFFDGVHLGHQEIIAETVAGSRRHGGVALVITFDRHPHAIVAPERVPALIYPLNQKIRVIEQLGPDALLLLSFTKALSDVPGEQFIRKLAGDLGAISDVCVGANFLFGHGRDGNVDLLRKLGAELRFSVNGLSPVEVDGHVVSSTRIRRAIHAGHLELAGRMLGRPYSILGLVVKGDCLGRQLGFPTANLDTSGLVLPPHGVYAARTRISGAGASFPSVLNIGTRPTLNQPTPKVRVEVHLLDFKGDLYGQELEVILKSRLRDECRFSGLPELRAQIQSDIETARRVTSGQS